MIQQRRETQTASQTSSLTGLILDTDAKHSQDIGRLKLSHVFSLTQESGSHFPFRENIKFPLVFTLNEIFFCGGTCDVSHQDDLIPWVGPLLIDESFDGHSESTVFCFVDL